MYCYYYTATCNRPNIIWPHRFPPIVFSQTVLTISFFAFMTYEPPRFTTGLRHRQTFYSCIVLFIKVHDTNNFTCHFDTISRYEFIPDINKINIFFSSIHTTRLWYDRIRNLALNIGKKKLIVLLLSRDDYWKSIKRILVRFEMFKWIF